jgi:hypothetical protein
MSTRANRLGSAYQDAKDGTYRPWRDSAATSGTLAALPKWQREPDLFADMVYPAVPGARREETSRDAATRIAPRVKAIHSQILAYLKERGNATAEESALHFGKDRWAHHPRFTELQAAGLIEKTGEKRPTQSGGSANVFRATNP